MLWVLFLTLEMGGCEQNFGTICVLVVMNVVTGKTAARGPQPPGPLTGWLSLSVTVSPRLSQLGLKGLGWRPDPKPASSLASLGPIRFSLEDRGRRR